MMGRYDDFALPPTDPGSLRAERTHLEPLLTLGGVPFTPTSACPHYCKTCSRTGSLVFVATGESFPCPDCGGCGTGHCCDGLREQPEDYGDQ